MKKNSDFTLQNFSKKNLGGFIHPNFSERNLGGFTLIELLVVIGILAILAGVVIVAVNPGRQFALTRNTKRQAAITQILSAIQQNKVENSGNFNCAVALPAAATNMGSDVAGGDYDIAACIVPTYIVTLPFDPSTGNYTDNTTYDTQYEVFQDAVSGQVTVTAPDTEI
ncbi:MAG: hypothetical protein A2122_00335, partial [Candidatus Liptonbacteria bacterium GWB1_49_6]